MLTKWKKLNAVGMCSAVTIMGFTSAALPQDSLKGVGFESGVSTLGVYLAPTYKINEKFVGRAAVYVGSITATETVDGNSVTGSFSTNSVALMADYLPFGNGLRLSGGLGLGGYELSGATSNPTFNGTTYAGSVDVTVKQSQAVVPVLAVGYAKTFKNGIGLVAELGARIGTYSLTASDASIPAGQKAQFAADVAKVNKDLKDIPATPYLTLGLSYRF